MSGICRREAFGAIGAVLATAVANGRGDDPKVQPPPETSSENAWTYVSLSPDTVAAEAYRFKPDGGCMYGIMKAVVLTWSKETGHSPDGFPFHMFRYGEGGISDFGTICGALNAGAAVIGLFERDKPRRTQLVNELFSWYERISLPRYRPAEEKSRLVRTTAESVLCHVSVAKWCKASGAAPLSAERSQRCRCLTADVAAKTIKLLNQNLGGDSELVPAEASPEPTKPPQSIGKMRCASCHVADQPDLSNATLKLPIVEPQ